MPKLSYIEGIGSVYEEKLNSIGIKTTNGLFKLSSTKKGRKDLAQKTGISEQLILEWTNHCDLFRITGVGSEYADLLEAAGVDTVVELAGRRPDNLVKKIKEINEEKGVVRKVPTEKQVTDWIAQAKTLPRGIEY